ncbi:uncharacterized protein LOC144002842 isoform X2 [Festucalex cinctus]
MLSRPPPGVTPQPAFSLADKDVYGSGSTPTLSPEDGPPPRSHPGPQLSCACATLLPRLLAAHRMEVRRLLRGALVSLGRRVDALERSGATRRRKKSTRRAHAQDHAHKAAAASASRVCASRPWSSLALDCSQSERKSGLEGRGIKRRRRSPRDDDDDEDEKREGDERGRFVGRMAVVCQAGGGATADRTPLALFTFDPARRQEGERSPKDVGIGSRRNGCSLWGEDDVLAFLRAASGQSQACPASRRQWRFSDFTPPPVCEGGGGPGAAPLLRLSLVAVATVAAATSSDGTGWNAWRPLRDRTAPPSLAIDHCYTQASDVDLRHGRTKRPADRAARKRLLAPPLPPPSSIGVAPPLIAAAQSAHGSKEPGKRVSQIRIRRTSPRETPLTPMGLPKVKRLKKKEFSVEEIYTNKNYKSPNSNRSLETIFEEPQEKDGALHLIGQQRRRRLLLFPDFTQPRKRKRTQGVGLSMAATAPRKRAVRRQYRAAGPGADDGAGDPSDLDVMLVERLSALEDFLTRQGLDV